MITLYHGSNVGIDLICLDKCSPFKDFGRGFYLADIEEQAWHSLSAMEGVNQVVTRFTPFITPKNIRLTVRKLRVMFYKTNYSKIKHISAFLNHCRNHLL